jgi:ABC-type phosphate transport system auxiliary subunit
LDKEYGEPVFMNNESTEKKIDEITSELKNIERRKQELTEELRALKSPLRLVRRA